MDPSLTELLLHVSRLISLQTPLLITTYRARLKGFMLMKIECLKIEISKMEAELEALLRERNTNE